MEVAKEQWGASAMKQDALGRKLKPQNVVTIVSAHVVAVFSAWYAFHYGFSAANWILFGILALASGFGLTVGYHRMSTHRSFRCGPVIRFLFSVCGGMGAEGSESEWVANHRVHHFFADQEIDPHSPLRYPGLKGLYWAHMGWLFYHYERPAQYRKFRDLEADPILQWQNRYYLPIVLAGFLLPFLFFGWKGLLLGGFLRLVVVWNITWSVNSICHRFGSRATDSLGREYVWDDSRNNLIVALIGLGEGFHSNHHARPAWAYQGWEWYNPDASKWLIQSLEAFGLAWDVKKPVRDVLFQDRAVVGIAS